jgi:uncharacterized protein YecE (DUF72 family)
MADARLYAGTSGFSYPSWKPDFYPKSVSSAKFLSYYATRLNAVEANYTYRRIAAASVFEKWIASTPDGFLFLPKAHMRITHILKLAGAEDFTRYFLESLEPLRAAGRLGPVLIQLAPTFKADLPRLSEFVRLLPGNGRFAFEFRHPSWFDEPVFTCLRDHNVGLCLAENEKLETPSVVTADFVYLRLRKPDYSDIELDEIGLRLKSYLASGRSVYAICKHEETPAGALNAKKLLDASNGTLP